MRESLGAIFAAIVDFLITALGLFFDWTGSYGLAIILLTLAVKIVLHPLTRRQLRSMKEMQYLAPQMAALREKYQGDPQRMNMEIMNLYRQHNVNPFGGCLPLVVQMPILYALFAVFRRQGIFDGARFLGVPLDAVPTLGAIAADPLLLVWPALVGISTYLQQRMSVTDPQQARMFVIMPFMVAYFATLVPVAMSVYWVTSTLAYILEFYIVVGRLTPPAPAAPAGAAKPPVSVLPQRPKGTKRK